MQSAVNNLGGGEPALDKNFEPLVSFFAEKFPKIKQRILTNCVKYSKVIENCLMNDTATILTSTDAGTRPTFEIIRGTTHFERVFKNMQRYVDANPKNVTIKYIFSKDNDSAQELRSLVDLLLRHRLNQSCFQISSDFKQEQVDVKALLSMIVLYGLLLQADFPLVYFDELIRQRVVDMSSKERSDLETELTKYSLHRTLADPKSYSDIIIWGAGHSTELLLSKSNFFAK